MHNVIYGLVHTTKKFKLLMITFSLSPHVGLILFYICERLFIVMQWFNACLKKHMWKDYCRLIVQRTIFDKTRKFIFCKYLNYASYVKGFQN